MVMQRVMMGLMVVMVCAGAAWAVEWHAEFEDICGNAQIADSLSSEELETLCVRCDALLPVIQASDDPKKKVYVFRLKKCRALFEFTIQTRQP